MQTDAILFVRETAVSATVGSYMQEHLTLISEEIFLRNKRAAFYVSASVEYTFSFCLSVLLSRAPL